MSEVRQATCAEVKRAVVGGARRLVDVRTVWEWELVHLPEAELLDEALLEQLQGLPRDAPLAFLCHHGIRSQQAAAWFAERGFVDVWNVAGGIEAWALEVDRDLPRY